MQISSITPNFQGRRDNVDALIGMDDNSIRQMAYMKTSAKIDHDRNRKITNGLFYSAPLAAGLGTALLSKDGATKMFSTNLTGTAGRAAKGLKVAGLWTAGLLALDALGAFTNKILEKRSEARKEYDRNHPLLTIGATIAAGFGVLALVAKGAGALSKVNAPKFLQNGTAKVAEFLNESKIMVKAKNGYKNLLAKTHPAIKDIGATALDLAPAALLFGGLFHSVASANAENREFAKNYTQLKNRQAKVAQLRVRELSAQNDFLMQDAKNKEDMKLMKDNFADLPEEISEKIEALHDIHAEEV